MLKVTKTKKNGLTLEHRTHDGPMNIDVTVCDGSKAFIKANAQRIEYDQTNEAFWVVDGGSKTTLGRAILKASGVKKLPKNLARRKDKYDFRTASLLG